MSNSNYPESNSSARTYPQRKAFVLQFTADAGPHSGVFAGRVEHVTTGDTAAFQSTEELWAFVRGVLTSPSHAVGTELPRLRAAG